MSERKKRNIIIGSLCGVLLLMVVGYAAFQNVLKIKGTSTINSNWDVRITNIEKIENKGETDNEGSPSYDNTNGLSATFNTSFTTPGDYATYKIEITNNGSMDAVLKKIKVPENTNNDIIFYLNKNQNNEDIPGALTQNSTLFKNGETGNIGYVYVTVLYKDYEDQQTAQEKTSNMTITFDFEQATGNDGTTGGEQAANQLIKTEVTTGDGLYTDTTEAGRYVYRGANPNNYINIKEKNGTEEKDVLYRIISVESDGTIKVIRNESLGNMAYDSANARSAIYCNCSQYGCNVWGSRVTMLDSNLSPISEMPREFNETSRYALPTTEASINTYLNGTYYDTLTSETKSNIDKHMWNVGLLAYTDGQTLETDVSQEKTSKWSGNIGLMNITDYIKTSTNSSCISAYAGLQSPYPCKDSNWLYFSRQWQWSLSAYSDSNSRYVWVVTESGQIHNYGSVYHRFNVHPVLYLTSNIHLDGEGTESNPYTIVS